MQVYIVGAGPGDPDLITVKGARLLSQADVVIYAGSLVNPQLLAGCKEGAAIYDSASMTLDEVLEVIVAAVGKGLMVVRLHTGDPSIYGAIKEQIDGLAAQGIDCEVIPGVSSFVGAASRVKKEFTLPGVSQTVILTRLEGRTGVPEKEKLAGLASHRASMCIFLSVGMMDKVVEELVAGGYAPATPVAVVHKATWPDEQVIEATLATISAKVKDANIGKTAMIMVGDFLNTSYEKSKLYDPSFAHEYRGIKS
ncbi:MAG TPA: precorrin-4 C(11)-methyltransferase [Bacillota bacterium]|nr:precorrin-4 C(11)-methyltransferase [Bacillota bacterium]